MATIRELRTERKWSQHDLALHLGVTAHTVYTWEKGLRVPTVPSLRRLAEVFGVPMERIALVPKPEKEHRRPDEPDGGL